MSDLTKFSYSMMRRSPGIILVGIGFMMIYLTVLFKGTSDPKQAPLSVYLGGGFGFLSFIAGVVLIFVELRASAGATDGEELPAVSGDLEHAVNQLSKNYEILRKQATQGFILAGIFMALGVCVILAGSVGELFGFTAQAGHLTTVAGIVVEAVSGLGLYLFRQTFHRLNITSDRLHDTWKILTAFRRAESLPEDKRAEMTCSLINRLIESSNPPK